MPLVRLSVLVAALVAAPTASAQTGEPCWQRVIADWTNGSVQSSYKAACYANALKRLPTDVRMYSDADQEIRRAMLAAIRKDDQPPTSGSTASATKDAAAATPAADARSRTLPMPVIFAITLALTLVAAVAVGRLRARRSAARQGRPAEQ